MTERTHNFERDVWSNVWQSKSVWLIHVVANAVLMLAFFYWLQIHDTSGGKFALSVIGGLSIAFATLTLHGATLDFFRQSPRAFRSSVVRAARHLFALLIWAVIFAFVLWLIGRLWSYDEQIGGWARHAMPGFLRSHFTPRSVITAATTLVGALFFIVWPILWIPFGSQVATRGFRGFLTSAALNPIRELRFWGVYVVCFVVGGYLPYKLAYLTPTKPSALSAQTASMIVRLGIGYLLLTTAWIIVCAAIARASDGQKEAVAVERVPTQPAPA